MTDKVHKIREEVARIQLYTQSEVLKQVLDYIDKVQEEPVSEDLEEAANNAVISVIPSFGQKNSDGSYVSSYRDCFKREEFINLFIDGAKWQKAKDEFCSKDLGEYINELSKQFPEVSFAKLSRIAVRVSRWQQNQDVKNKLPKVTDRTELDEYAYQCAYDMSNDWATDNPTWKDVEDACKLGAKWQKEQFEKNRLAACDRQTEEEAEREQDFVMGIIENEHRQPTFDDAIKYGMRLQKKHMMAEAIDVEVKVDAGGYPYIPQMELYDYNKDIPLAKEGDRIKVIVIKED